MCLLYESRSCSGDFFYVCVIEQSIEFSISCNPFYEMYIEHVIYVKQNKHIMSNIYIDMLRDDYSSNTYDDMIYFFGPTFIMILYFLEYFRIFSFYFSEANHLKGKPIGALNFLKS